MEASWFERRYLVSLYGESAWVRNLRASGTARLRFGRVVEEVVVTEVPGDEAIQAYGREVRGPVFRLSASS